VVTPLSTTGKAAIPASHPWEGPTGSFCVGKLLLPDLKLEMDVTWWEKQVTLGIFGYF